MDSSRAGVFIKQPSGYSSFVPNPLPPDPPIKMDQDMIYLLSDADMKLGRLDGITRTLPNPRLFVAMYVKKEAVLSSQIEGTQASLVDVLDDTIHSEKRESIDEVFSYVKAMHYGLERLEDFPLSLRLIREIHAELLSTGRGSEKNPGEFRTSQNWIGPTGCNLQTATFVPPTVPDMKDAIGQLELFFYNEDPIPPLIKIAMIHAQFETIHPFLDGNGRMGRLLITFLLCQQHILSQPLLYLSYYFKQNKQEYYDRLMDVRKKGLWEEWISFFLKGVSSVSEEASNTAQDILQLQSTCKDTIKTINKVKYNEAIDLLFETPYVSKASVGEHLMVTPPTASKIVDDLCLLGILKDISPNSKRKKSYCFQEYMNILSRGTDI